MWLPRPCDGSPVDRGDDRTPADGIRAVAKSTNTCPMVGVPRSTKDVRIDHALCGTH